MNLDFLLMYRLSTRIVDFGHELFVACMIKNFVDQENIKSQLKINKNGIQNQLFIDFCCQELVRFKNSQNFSAETLEEYYNVKFVHISYKNGKVFFKTRAAWGKNIIFIEANHK